MGELDTDRDATTGQASAYGPMLPALLGAALLSLGADCGPGPPVLLYGVPAPEEPDSFGHFTSDQVWTDLSVGTEQSCGLTDAGEVRCRGFEGAETPQGPSGPYTELAVGTDVCALDSDRLPRCWPDRVGNSASVPPRERPLRGLSAASGVGCGITDDGGIVCWGDDEGLGTPPEDASGYSQVAVGELRTCALNLQGELSCWGGLATENPPSGRFVDVASGFAVSCAVSEAGVLTCWGDLEYMGAHPNERALMVDLHWSTGCVLTADRAVLCWGANIVPGRYADGPFVKVDVGRDGGCGLDEDGGVECWRFEEEQAAAR